MTGTEPSGTDELFPGATEHPGVAAPVGTPPPGAVAPVSPPIRRGLGVSALILGILAVLGDLIGIVVAFIALAGAVTHVGETLSNVDNSLGAFLGVIVLEFVVFGGGILFGLLAVVLGIIAAIRRRGRAAGIVGIVLGALVLLSHLGLAIVIGTSGNVPGVTS
jgi:hypothetical protein